MAVQQKGETEKRKCPPHRWIINSQNVGHCKYCPAVRDFLELLRRAGVYVAAGKSGARKATSGKKRGRKKKEAIT